MALRQAPFEEGEPLDEAEIAAIVEVAAPSWSAGQRHDLALALAGWMAGHGVPEDSARSVVDRLAHGDPVGDRRRAVGNVRDTYAKVESGHPVAGWSVLVRDQLLDTGALDALDRLMDGRPVNQVEAAITNPDRPEMPYIVTLDEFLQMDLPEQSWLVKGMLLEASVNLLIGPPKTFKTFFELERHFAIATGSECFGIFPTGEPRKTCYVQRELESSAWQGRLRRMVKGSGLQMADVEDRMLLINGHKVRVDDVEDMRRFTDELLVKHPDLALVTFDTFRKSHGQDENDNNKMDELVMDVLLRIRDEFRIAIDLIHHTNKAREVNSFEEQMRGAVVIWGSCDDGLWLQRIKDDGDEMIRKTKVSFHGRNIETTTPFGFRLVDTAGGGLAFETFPLGDTSDRRKQTHEKVRDWLDTTPGWHDKAAVGRALGLGDAAAARAMQRLVEGGEVRDKRGDYNRKWVASKRLPLQDDLDF
ncbi:MAG: AAA family ATPase [Gammaproteobacteria bacterium]|nr:AAA family ATPase [Gammaproteobacteria bacterium]